MTDQLRKVLLISGTSDDAWVRRLRSVVCQIGALDVVQKPGAFDQILRLHYNIVIVDEAQLMGADYVFILQILHFSPDVCVIVASGTPDWQRARRAFQAGAADYIPMSTSSADLLDALQKA